jgi:hypothetical protein
MARIRTYGLDSNIDPADKIIGTDGTPGPNQGDTKNFSVSSLVSYIEGQLNPVDGSGTANTIPMWTPDGDTLGDSIITTDTSLPVETDGIVVNGKFRVEVPTGTNAFGVSNEVVSHINARFDAGIIDSNSSLGTAGQALLSTSTATEWSTFYLGYQDQAGDFDIKFGYNDGVTNTTTHAVRVYAGSGITLTDNASLGFSISADNQIPADNITGSGTVDSIAIFTPDGQTIGNSDIIRTGLNTYQINSSLTVPTNLTTTNFYVNNIFAGDSSYVGISGNTILGNAGTDTIIVNGEISLIGAVKDSNSTLGTDGQILISDASGLVSWGDQTSYTYSSTQDGSGVVLTLTDGTTPQEISLVAGADISLVDNGNNEITINATGGAANTTYDLDAIIDGGNGKIRLTGSDTTTDIVTITPGDNIVITSPSSNELNIATASDVVKGSGTLNTIPLWTPDGQTLGDSSISFDPVTESVIIEGTSGTTQDLLVTGVDARITIASNTAGDANLEFKPNATSNHAAVFELTDADFNRHFLWQDNGNEIMRLKGSNGNLGLGVTNPTHKITINSDTALLAESSGQTYFRVSKDASKTIIGGTVNGTMRIGFSNSPGFTQDLEVQGTGRFEGGIKDANDLVGISGQVLSSTGSDVEWIDNTSLVAGTDISISQVGNEYTINSTATLLNTTYDLTGAANGNNYDITLTGSDATSDIVQLAAGTNITLVDNGSNTVTIETLDHIATREQNPLINPLNGVIPVMNADDPTIGGLYYSGITTYQGGLTMPGFNITGDIRGDVNVDGTVSATDFIFTTGFPFYTEIGSISDFEEGTWTPDMKTYLTNILNPIAGLQFDTQLGTYIKVNDKVFCEFKIRYKLQATYDWPADEYLVITGLPFTPEGSIRNSNLSGNINRLSSFNSVNADELPRLLSNACSPFYDVVIPTGMGLLPPQNTNSGTKPLLASLFSDQDDYTGGNYVEFYGSFTYTTA